MADDIQQVTREWSGRDGEIGESSYGSPLCADALRPLLTRVDGKHVEPRVTCNKFVRLIVARSLPWRPWRRGMPPAKSRCSLNLPGGEGFRVLLFPGSARRVSRDPAGYPRTSLCPLRMLCRAVKMPVMLFFLTESQQAGFNLDKKNKLSVSPRSLIP